MTHHRSTTTGMLSRRTAFGVLAAAPMAAVLALFSTTAILGLSGSKEFTATSLALSPLFSSKPGIAVSTRGFGGTCEDLVKLTLPNTTITSAQLITTSPFQPPPSPDTGFGSLPSLPISGLPPFCRVTGSVKPTSESDVVFEVWMPVSGWTGRYQGVGNAVYLGSIQYPLLAASLLRGNAVSSTNAGHWGFNALWALGRPQLVLDYALGFHYMAQASKPIIAAFYGTPAKYSYFTGCSAGGNQSLWEAQRHPEDFDGYLAGCPGISRTRLNWSHVWNGKAFLNEAGTDIGPGGIPQEKWPAVAAAVLDACDALDGLVDGQVTDSRKCKFDPATIQCQGADNNNCLTAAQVEAIKKYYAGAVNPRTGERIFPGYLPGVDPLWFQYLQPVNQPRGLGVINFFKGIVFNDINYDALKSDFDTDVARGEASVASILNATDPDLRPIKARGGKVIHWHSMQDQNIASGSSIDYYEEVTSFMGGLENTRDFYRFFLAPGMKHCAFGDAPNSFNGGPGHLPTGNDPLHDMQTALEVWVEKGIAPDKIIATKFVNDNVTLGVKRTRPLCPYPEAAAYSGSGSIDDATNFVCVPPIQVRIKPSTLNLKRKGVFAAFITAPDGYNIRDWNLSDVTCAGAPAVIGATSNNAYIAVFKTQDLQDVSPGDAVELLIKGFFHRDGQPAIVQSTGTTKVIK
jgi:Tannase and feruloyl esterase